MFLSIGYWVCHCCHVT
ncbi:thioredoxin domain-containing protein [Clostridium psychrophilum]|nr:thioredoxin domain-containing protein [Clostridium psychrophilum]